MQTIFKGIEHLNEALEGSTKVLIVCDSSFPYLPVKDAINNIIIPYTFFTDFTPNPLYNDVCKGVDTFQQSQCDTIIAIGGGSSIDVAKCIKLYCKMDKTDIYINQEYKDTGIKLIAIPTTAGTGSESTKYAVIYFNEKKQSVTHDSIIPNVAILEPKVLMTLPLYQKKCTMLDALCQGIESWWSINSTEKSILLSKKAIETILKWWREYIFQNSYEAAQNIMGAANYAGQAINISQTTAAHAFSYKLTSIYKIPHGHAVAIGLPQIWEYMLDHIDKCVDPRGSCYLNKVFLNISNAMGCATSKDAIKKFYRMMREMGISNPISLNKDQDVENLAHSVNPIRLKNNPIELNEHAIMQIYYNIVG